MFDTKCGCPFCKGGQVLNSRLQWKARQDKHHRTYGSHCKGTHHRGKYR